MTNGSYLWPGDKMRAFFRAHIARETSLDAAAADKLSEALTSAVNRMLVWDIPAEGPSPAPAQASKTKPASAFDPFAFSLPVVLAKTGRDGLMKRLADIKSAENLKSLAEAQHLAIPPSLKKADDLRKAIVTATEQRLADRKAAAS
jgi:hypothetical protein